MVTRPAGRARMAAEVGRLEERGVMPLAHAVANPTAVHVARDERQPKVLAPLLLGEDLAGLLEEEMAEAVGSGPLELGDQR